MGHSKNLLVLTDARYGELHKFRGWNKLVSVLDEPRLFARLFPELTKAEHQRLATWYAEQEKAMRTSWHQAVEHAEHKYGADGPLISAGLRNHWPKATKDRIRKLAHSMTELSDAAQSHWRASGKRGPYVSRTGGGGASMVPDMGPRGGYIAGGGAKTRRHMHKGGGGAVLVPESWKELDTYLDRLNGITWRAILHARHIGHDERVIAYLRRMDPSAFRTWTNEELDEYLVARDLKEDFRTVGERD